MNPTQAQFAASIDLSSLDGSIRFIINGIDIGDDAGWSVSGAGDVNGDGFDDVIIGAINADFYGNYSTGETYVIFGKSSDFDANLNLSSLDGNNGFILNGINEVDFSGFAVSTAGDINGDGFDDVIIGARLADPNGNISGETYVVFGKGSDFGASLNLSSLNGTNGFVLNGIKAGDLSGHSVSEIGDLNGDGFDDIIIGAIGAEESYVIFGKSSTFNASLNLSSLNGTNGFILKSKEIGDNSGIRVSSAGDVNDDGFDDVIIGANTANPNGNDNAGESYIVFGKNGVFPTVFELSSLSGTNGFILNGINEDDYSGQSTSGVGDVNDDGFDDVIIGANTANPNGNTAAGETYVVFGSSNISAPSLELSSLNGTNGFVLNGIDNGDISGFSVSGTGDINGDGILIGASAGGVNGNKGPGEVYVVFGNSNISTPSLELSSLNGENGFVLKGTDAFDVIGFSVSGAGDVNGDKLQDIIIGGHGSGITGKAFLVFGKDGFAPVFTSPSIINFTENGIGIIYTAVATDATAITYSLSGGDDQNLFSINSSTGDLTFNNPPDFEAPTDVDANNEYLVEITAIDAFSNTSTLMLTVIVINVNETGNNQAPIVSNLIANQNLSEGFGTEKLDLSNVFTDANGDALNYSASSSEVKVVTVEVNGTVLSITEVNAGTSTIIVKADDDNGGIVTDEFTVTVVPISSSVVTSLEEVETGTLLLYPNPTEGTIQVEGFGGQVNFILTDTQGQEVLSGQAEDAFELDVSDLPKGVYILTLEDKEGIVSRKIVKK